MLKPSARYRVENWTAYDAALRCRSLGEVAMMRYKHLIGRSLRVRSLSTQKVETALGCKVMNIMTSLGMPATRKVV